MNLEYNNNISNRTANLPLYSVLSKSYNENKEINDLKHINIYL